jgi:hypothetical protein
VTLPLSSRFKRAVATLCVALAMFVVGLQAVSIANRFIHEGQPAHAHDIIEAQLLAAEPDHSDHADHDQADDPEERTKDGPVGSAHHHHHHGDTVGGFMVASSDVSYSLTDSSVCQPSLGDHTPCGWTPDGPDRPPRTLTTSL